MRTDERLTRVIRAGFVAALCVLSTAAGAAAAQQPPDDLARRVEQRFSVLAITDGVVLTPREPMGDVRSIELSRGTISIDGTPVSGAELRARVGDAADLVLQLSYLTPADQRALAGAPPAEPPQTQPDSSRRNNDRSNQRIPPRVRGGGDIVHIGRGVRVEQGDVIRGDAVSVGGSVTVLGEVRGDVVSIGGSVDLGPQAVVSGDVTVVGGTLNRDPAARVGGKVQEVGWGAGDFGDWMRRSWTRPSLIGAFGLGAPLAFIAQVMRVGVLCLLAVLVVLVAGNIVERVGQRAAAEPLKAGAVGFLAQLLFLPLLIVTIVLLVVTIVGIPLLVLIPFAILALVLVALVGFTAVAYRVGQIAAERFSWTIGPYLRTVAGVVILLIPLLLARLVGLGGFPLSFVSFLLLCIGWIVEYVAWTVGFGAVALTRFSKTAAALAPKPS